MAEYYPPIENITEFNTALFTNEPDAISQGQASLLYLSKVNSDTSTAPLTTFSNNVSFTVLPQSSAVPSNLPDLVNKSYTDTTFQTIANMVNYLTTSVASATYLTIANASATYQTIANMVNYVDIASGQTITGLKLFTNNLEVYNANANLTLRVSSGTTQQSTVKQNGSQLQIINNSTSPTIVFTVSTATKLTLSPTQCLLDATCFLTTNDIKSRAPTLAHTLLSDITTGTLTISSTTASNTINGATTFPQTATFSVIPNCSITATSASQLVNYTTLTTQGYTTLPIIQANANAWTNTNSFNSFLPTSTITATTANQLVNFTTLTTQGYTTLALVQANNNAWTGTNSFNSFLPTSTITATTANQLVNYTTLTTQGYTTLALVQANNNIWTGTNQFNELIKVRYATTQYTELDQTAQNFHIYNRSISGSVYIHCQTAGALDTTLAVFNTSGISIGVSSITNTISGPTTFNNFPSTSLAPVLGDHLVNRTYADTKTTLSAVQSNNNAFTGFNTFNTNLPTSTISASSANQLVNYTTLTGQGYTTLALVQSNNNAFTGTNSFSLSLQATTNLKTGDIVPISTAGQQNIYYNNLTVGGTIFFGTASRVMNIFGQVVMNNTCQFNNAIQANEISFASGQGGTAKNIYSSITSGATITMGSTACSNTIRGNTTFTNSLISNNITAPSSSIAGVNNIFTNLSSTGYGIINIGAFGDGGTLSSMNQINIKSKLNIVESYYGTTPTKITQIYQEGDHCRFINTGGTAASILFSIDEGGLYDPLRIYKNRVEIIGDETLNGNLILNDTTPSSTKKITIGVITDDLTFEPNNTIGTTYNFIANDSSTSPSPITALTISSDSTTINTKITHKQTQLVNEVKTISGTTATLTLPLEQTLMLTSTGATNINITLPELNDSKHAGFTFNVIKTGSITNSVVFTRSGSNLIRGYGSITGSTSLTLMVNTATIINMITLEVSAGNFEWVLY